MQAMEYENPVLPKAKLLFLVVLGLASVFLPYALLEFCLIGYGGFPLLLFASSISFFALCVCIGQKLNSGQ